MPYEIKPDAGGYVVANKETGQTFSNRPLTLEKAKAQMKALYSSEKKQKPMKELASKSTKTGRKGLYSRKTQEKEDDVLRKLSKLIS
jgi:hypothetical protein